MITIQIPGPLRRYTEEKQSVEVDASSVREALARLTDIYPGIENRILTKDKELRTFVNIYVDDEDISQLGELSTPLKPGSEMMIVPAISGGTIPV